MKQRFSIWLFVAVVIILPAAVFAIVKWHENHYVQPPVLGKPGHKVGEFTMWDQHGNLVTERAWDNKVVVANFFFTHCPVVCPKMMRQMKRVQSYARKQILISSFTVDPERDTIEVLKKYADKHDIAHNWQLLTGSKKDIYLLARKDFLVMATDGDGGPDDFIHSDNLVLIDTKKRIRGFYKGTNESEVNRLINDIKKLDDELK
jgi:protein SCO1/2